jgi:hypothetical protein
MITGKDTSQQGTPQPEDISDALDERTVGWTGLADHGLTGVLAHMVSIMVGVEAAHHDLGWDNLPSTLFRVTPNPASNMPTTPIPEFGYDLAVRQVPDPSDLALFAAELEAPPADLKAELAREPSPVAHLFVAEGWRGTRPDARTHLADVPGSVEVRTVLGVVSPNHLLYLRRVRGEAPKVLHERVDHPEWGGQVYTNLARIQAASSQLYAGSNH